MSSLLHTEMPQHACFRESWWIRCVIKTAPLCWPAHRQDTNRPVRGPQTRIFLYFFFLYTKNDLKFSSRIHHTCHQSLVSDGLFLPVTMSRCLSGGLVISITNSTKISLVCVFHSQKYHTRVNRRISDYRASSPAVRKQQTNKLTGFRIFSKQQLPTMCHQSSIILWQT